MVVYLVAITTAGCGSTGAQPGVSSFFREHAQQVARVGASTREVEAKVRALAKVPTKQQLTGVTKAAQQADEHIDEARSGWSAFESGEEEELFTIETQLVEGASELKSAMAAIVTYAGNPEAAALLPYNAHIKSGREKWNEGISQLWYLVKRPHPPTV
jgi:hypothetical protein